jgi:large repetitive protein
MALLIEQQTRDIGVVRTPLGPERTRIVVRPGDTIRFVDDAGKPPTRLPRMQVRRLDNSLIIDGLPGDQVIELNNFFGACRPGAECAVALEGLGAGAVTITEETPPIAPLADGSFLLYSDNADTAAASALPVSKAVESGGPSVGTIAAVGGGLALVGLAAGGGGGGGGSGPAPVTDTTPPAAPVITSGPVLKASSPIVTGEAEAGARVTFRIDVNGNGVFTDTADVTYTTTADANGRWTVDLRGTPQSGTLPAGGLVDGQSYAVFAQAVDAAQNVSAATRAAVSVDGTAPRVPLINVVAGDDVVNAAERAAGITVTGTAEAGSAVAVSLGGATVNTTAQASGAWSATFAAAQLPAAGLSAVSAVATDAAGNASTAATRQVAFETNVPGAPVITDNVTGTATGPVTFTLTFDKPVSGITADDVTVTGGTKGTFLAVSETVYTLVVTPTDGVQSGQIIVQLPAGAGADAAGNPTTAASPSIQAYDTLPPSVRVSTSTAGPTTGPVTFTFTFSEAVTGFTASDVVVTGGTAGALSGSGTTYTMVVTPPADASGALTVDLPAARVVDAVGQDNTALAAPVSVPFDTAAPTLTITDNVPGATAGGTVTYTFTFSEAVSGFGIDDVTVTGVPGGTIGTLTTVSPSVYTLAVTPAANTSGSIGVSVAAAAVIDGAGNASGAAAAAAQAFNTDTSLPTLTITDSVPGGTPTTGPVTFTFTWSEPVTGFTFGDIVASGGGTGTFGSFAGSGATYTAVYTPAANESGTFNVSVAAGTVVDANGNANAAGAGASQSYDRAAPTLAITDSVAGATATGTVTYTFTFSEPVTGFDIADVTVTGLGTGTIGALTTVSSSVYTLAVTPAANTSGTLGVSVPGAAATDASGNPSGAASAAAQAYNTDTTAPTVAITDTTPGTATGPVTFTFTFSEPVTGFTVGDIATSAGASVGSFTAVSSTVYTAVVSPPSGSGTYTVSVPASAAIDGAGNGNTASAVVSQGYAAPTTPTLVITDDQAGTTSFADQTVLYTFTFSEAVTLFDRSDITVSGASFTAPGTFTAVSATVYTLALDLAPSAGTAGTLGVSVAAGAAINGSAVGNAGPVSATQAYDLLRPTVAITDNVSATTTSGPITFTFTTSEAVTGFDATDVTVSGGSVTTAFAGSGSVYTMTVTPAAGVASGTVSVSVGASAFTDTAGNLNTAGASGLQSIDTVAPGVATAASTGPGGTAIADGGSTTDTTPRLVLTLDQVLLAGETVALLRNGTQVQSISSGSVLTHDSAALAAGGTLYTYSATFTNGSGTTSALDLNGATAGDTYRITIT